MALDTVTDSMTPDGLILAGAQYLTKAEIIDTGDLARGTVLGKITASGKCITSLSAATDGSEVPYGILLEDANATSADKVAPVLIAGEVDGSKLTVGTGHTVASITDGLRDKGIYIRTVAAV